MNGTQRPIPPSQGTPHSMLEFEFLSPRPIRSSHTSSHQTRNYHTSFHTVSCTVRYRVMSMSYRTVPYNVKTYRSTIPSKASRGGSPPQATPRPAALSPTIVQIVDRLPAEENELSNPPVSQLRAPLVPPALPVLSLRPLTEPPTPPPTPPPQPLAQIAL